MRLPQRKRALVVGIDHYADSQIPSLETARADAIAVSRQLQRIFSYDVHTLLDPERADIVKALKQLATEASPNDTVTLYFAGHGYRDEQTGNGYWIPADAQARSPERWLSNNDIAALLGQIPARQILVVSDSCFSGSLVRDLASNTTLTRSPVSALSQRTVIALSSGGDEPVSDEGANGHSVFAEQFMRVLDRVTGLDVSSRVYSAVRNAVSQQLPQTPQYSRVTSPLHPDGGDYVIQTGQGSRQRP